MQHGFSSPQCFSCPFRQPALLELHSENRQNTGNFLITSASRSLRTPGENRCVSPQFPYEPDYGDGQSLNSSSAADQLVHEVKLRETAGARFTKK